MPRRPELSDDERKALAAAVREATAGMTQAEIAARMGGGRHQTMASRIKLGGSYGEKAAREVCALLGLDFEQTIGRPPLQALQDLFLPKPDPSVLEAAQKIANRDGAPPPKLAVQLANVAAEKLSDRSVTFWVQYIDRLMAEHAS